MSTEYMGLTLPEETVTPGPDWATELNTALTSIDSHDHSTGKGNQVTTAGINIDSDLSLGNYGLTDVGSQTFQSLSALVATNNVSYVKDGDLYFNDGSGNQVRVTSGGALNVGSIGGIGGDYGTTAATCFYTDASLTYFFQDSAAAAAKLNIGDLAGENAVFSGDASCVNLTVTTAATIASATITATTGTSTHAGSQIFNGTITANNTVSFLGATSGFGVIPIGGMVPIASNLSGAHTVPASGVVDAAGWMYANGAAIPGGNTLSGSTPNLTDARFIMGSSSSGTTGGSNTMAHTHAGPSHVHSGPSHVHSGPSHSHVFYHTHQSMYVSATSGTNAVFYGRSSSVPSSTTVSAGDTSLLRESAASSAVPSGAFHVIGDPSSNTDIYTAGVVSAPSGSGSSARTAADGTGNTGSSGTANTGSSGTANTGAASNAENRPLYVTAQYLIRVK